MRVFVRGLGCARVCVPSFLLEGEREGFYKISDLATLHNLVTQAKVLDS